MRALRVPGTPGRPPGTRAPQDEQQGERNRVLTASEYLRKAWIPGELGPLDDPQAGRQ